MEINVMYGHRGRDVQDALDTEALAAFVLEQVAPTDNLEVSIRFVTNDEIHELNRQFRDCDRPTDVLSFECDGADDDFDSAAGFVIEGVDEDAAGDADVTAEDDEAVRLDDVDIPFQLGDIMVAVDVAEAQAPGFGLSLGDELSLLVTHGLLHLCGWDHIDPDEACAMEDQEQKLLSDFWGRPFNRHGVSE